MKIKYSTYKGDIFILGYDNSGLWLSTVIININCDEYPRYKEYCNGSKLAKIIRVETNPHYIGKGFASKLLQETINKFKDYNLLLLCSPMKRCENTDTLKTVSDLQMFYSKFGFVRTNELLPTMIRKSNIK